VVVDQIVPQRKVVRVEHRIGSRHSLAREGATPARPQCLSVIWLSVGGSASDIVDIAQNAP